MESNRVQNLVEDGDRFSKLPDHMLLYILERANMPTSVRASFLSKRWRHLPSLLPHISLNASDFMPSNNTSVSHIAIDEAAMEAITKAARLCLAAGERGRTVKTVNLRLLLTSKYLYDIGKLVCQAIENGEVKRVELSLPTKYLSLHSDVVDMVHHAKTLICFFDAAPNLFQYLTSLVINNARFDELQLHRPLNSCEQLQQLVLNDCDTGDRSVLKIDMPN